MQKEPPTLDQFQTLLEARQSCRAFLPDQIPDETIEKIVTVAQKVPSWCNAQPWKLIITRGPTTDGFRAALAKALHSEALAPDIAFPKRYDGIYRERRRICGWQLYDAVGVKKGNRAASHRQMLENYHFFGAPHVAIVTTEAALGAYGVLDCGAFITAFMLAAKAEGVGSIAQAALAAYGRAVRAHFDIPANRQIVCGISFGHPDTHHPANGFRTGRADWRDVIDWR